MNVTLESPDQREVVALISELDAYQETLYPPESRHALDIDSLKQPNLGATLLTLETGPYQNEALSLYGACGYVVRGPFGKYVDDPLSVFMQKHLLPKDGLPEPG